MNILYQQHTTYRQLFLSIAFQSASEDDKPFGVRFNNDGSKMFIAGRTNQKVFEYSLSVNFDISEADYTGNSFDVSSQVKSVFLGLAFSHDGTMMYITDGQGAASTDSIYQFSLNKSFDLSGGGNLIRSVRTTVTLETLETNESEPNGIAFNKSGTRMFLIGTKVMMLINILYLKVLTFQQLPLMVV